MTYSYPAVFQKESVGGYSIFFPDIEGCYTSAECFADGLDNAEDVLSLMLYEMRKDSIEFPEASDKNSIEVRECDSVVLIEGDPEFYERYFAEYHPATN